MKFTLRFLLYSLMGRASIAEALKPVVTRQPNWPQVFIGETMRLRCEVQGHTGDWSYDWQKDGQSLTTTSEMQEITFLTIDFGHSGAFKCIATNTKDHGEAESEPYHVVVLEIPKATLTVLSPQPLFSSGVTLSCDAAGGEGWDYNWERDLHLIADKTSQTITVSLPDERGQYRCYGKRKGSSHLLSLISDQADIFDNGPGLSKLSLGVMIVLSSAILLFLVIGPLYCIIKRRGLFRSPSQLDQDERSPHPGPAPSSDLDERSLNQDQCQYGDGDAHTYESIPLTGQNPAGASVPGLETVYSLLKPEEATNGVKHDTASGHYTR